MKGDLKAERQTRWLPAAALALLLAGCCSWSGGGQPGQPAARPRPGTGSYLEAIDADLALAARGFLDGKATGDRYLALARDRAAKARRYRDDPAWREAAKEGDRDRDRVPDRLDRCPTPELTATDGYGCPPPEPPECAAGGERCPGPRPGDEARLRDLLEKASILIDPGCESAATPPATNPLAWGRAAGDANAFLFQVGRSAGTPSGCDLYYEMELRIELLHQGAEPLVRYLTVLFKAKEDLTPLDSRRAVFRVAFPETVTEARSELWGALMNAREVRWKVRAVNGAQRSSAWSPMKTKSPVAGGIAL